VLERDVRIIKKTTLYEQASPYPDAKSSLDSWVETVQSANWTNFAQLRRTYSTADLVGKLTVFNISGNKYRLAVYIDYKYKLVFIRRFMTHAEYNKNRWKDDNWF
jgi:mRNA interferase HigB